MKRLLLVMCLVSACLAVADVANAHCLRCLRPRLPQKTVEVDGAAKITVTRGVFLNRIKVEPKAAK